MAKKFFISILPIHSDFGRKKGQTFPNVWGHGKILRCGHTGCLNVHKVWTVHE